MPFCLLIYTNIHCLQTSSSLCLSPTHQVADGLGALAVLPSLRLQRRLQADAFLLQAQLAALQQAAFVLQLTHVGFQLLQLLAALCLGFTEPRRRLGLGSQQCVGFFQLMERKKKKRKKKSSVNSFIWLLITFLFGNSYKMFLSRENSLMQFMTYKFSIIIRV